MKRDTRQEILQTAKELFNERGFNAVSTRDIAGALGISKGNLTYYFKKKEEIMEAIIAESQEPPPPEAPKNLAEMDAFFLRMQQVVQANAFYFWHHAQLSQVSPKIREQQKSIYKDNFDKFLQAFSTLQRAGLLRKENFSGEYDRVIDTLLLSIIYWIPFCYLKQENRPQVSFEHHAWTIVYSLLTEKGKEMLREIVSI